MAMVRGGSNNRRISPRQDWCACTSKYALTPSVSPVWMVYAPLSYTGGLIITKPNLVKVTAKNISHWCRATRDVISWGKDGKNSEKHALYIALEAQTIDITRFKRLKH